MGFQTPLTQDIKQMPLKNKSALEVRKMSPTGWVQTITGSSIIDRVQNVQQAQVDINQMNAEARALQEEAMRQTTVTVKPDGEKVRMRKRDEERRKMKQRRRKGDEKKRKQLEKEKSENGEKYKRIHVTV